MSLARSEASSDPDARRTARCLCGAIRVTIRGPLPDVAACHCGQCRRWSGHVWAAVPVPDDRLTIEGAEHIRWYRSSDKAERGFCTTCGSSMFWRAIGRGDTANTFGCMTMRQRPMPSLSRNGSSAMIFSRAATSPRITQ